MLFRSRSTGVAVLLLAWDTQLRADAEADDSDKRGKRAERRDMTDLNAATTRLHEAIGTLEQALQVERKAAADTAQALTAAQDTLVGNAQQLSTMAAATASAEAAVEADREAAAAAMTEAQQEILSLREELAEVSNAPAPEPDTAEIEALQASVAELDARLQEAERTRDQAIANAEATAAERDEALARKAELEEARHDDAKLRAEAADALDAAIGELKTLSGERANG